MRRLIIFCLLIFFCSTVHAKTVGLALSGGGARGFAHIGVLKAFEEAGFEPDLIVGSSMGAVIGGLYAAGYSTRELESIARSADWSELFLDRPQRRNLFLGQKETISRHIFSMRFRGWVPEVPMALSKGQQLSEMLFDYVYHAPYSAWPSFDDLKIPFRAVATDISHGEPVVFSQGDLAEAMRASISMPLVFTPYEMNGRQLVDGGVIENVPVEITLQQGADVVIAVNLSTGITPEQRVDLPWELADRVTTIMQKQRISESLGLASVVITPEIGSHSSTDFTNVDSLIQEGYRAAKEQITAVLEAADKNNEVQTEQPFSFASQATLKKFWDNLPERGLPPESYFYEGITALPDSQLMSLPMGNDGLGRLTWIRRQYQQKGMSLAHATELEMGSDGVLFSRWEEGRIRSIRVSGLHRFQSWALLREFPLQKGDIFDYRRAKRGIGRLYGNDQFQFVTLSVWPGDDGPDLTIRVQERPSPQLRFGAGFSSERKGRGFVEFLHDNIGAVRGRLALFGKYAERDELLRARWTVDRLFRTYLTSDASLYWSRYENYFYDGLHKPTMFYFFERSGADFWAGQAFHRWGQLAGGIRYQDIQGGGVDIEPAASVLFLGLRSLVDTKDSYPFPTRGVKFHAQYDYGAKVTRERRFNRTTFMGDAHLPITHRVVAHGRLDWGWNDFRLPLWGQFPLGGQYDMLGLRNSERYGNNKVFGLAELRYDLLSRFLADAYVSALYTLGAVNVDSDPFPASKDYQHAAGGAFALSTFLGPMTLTAAELMPSRFGTGHFQLYLNLGHEF
ncbi:patatin-like phospholipase family protein [bacterium]|nr:patatin-like phospholipase family protein [bacterium]